MKNTRYKTVIFSLLPLLILIVASELVANVITFFKFDRLGYPINKLIHVAHEENKDGVTIYKMPLDQKTGKLKQGSYQTNTGVKYHVNKYGFRGKDFSRVKDDEYRVISFGGSSTLGLESGETETYPAALESMMKRVNSNSEVLNFGISSKSLKYIVELLVTEALDYSPDIITIYSNRNSALYDSATVLGSNLDTVNNKLSLTLLESHFFLMNNWMTYKVAYEAYVRISHWIHSKDNAVAPYHKWKVPMEYFKSIYLNTLLSIISLAEQHDFKVVLIKQPLLVRPDVQLKLKKLSMDRLLELLGNSEKISQFGFDGLTPEEIFWVLTNTILNKQMESLNGDDHVIVIDPVERFLLSDSLNDFFSDYVHLTPAGNRLLAEEIFSGIAHLLPTSAENQ